MDWLRHDLRQALRLLARRPGFSALAILTLALGLAINTVAFSAVNALVFKPFRFAGAHVTGWLFVAPASDPLADSSWPAFAAIERRTTTLEAIAAEGRMPLAYDNGSGTEQIWALFVSPAYFSLVQTLPLSGRTIGAQDGDGDDVPVLVSERFWRRRLDADPQVASRSILLNRHAARIVGVLADGFQGPGGVFEPDVWVPLAARHALAVPAHYDEDGTTWLTLIARPRDGIPAVAVEQEVVAIVRDAGAASRPSTDPLRARYVRFIEGHPETRQLFSLALAGLVAVGIVLLIACFNVAGLVLARSVERRRDLGLRSALGASRWRLARQQLTEGLVLALAGALVALLVGRWSAMLLSVFSLPAPIPQRLHFAMDWRVLTFTSLLALIATVLPALAPLAQMARADIARWLGTAGTAQAGGLGQRGTRRLFVVFQVAGSTCFLALALVFGRNLLRESNADPGFDAAHVAVLEINPSQYGYTQGRARELADLLVSATRRTPGVRAAAVTDRVSFFVGMPTVRRVSVGGRDCRTEDCPRAGGYAADSSYFAAMGIRLVAGRVFDAENPADRDTVVISETAASTFWPGESAIGRTFRTEPDGRAYSVVGVAADIVHRTMSEPRQPYFYRPLGDEDYGAPFTIVARAADTADTAAAALSRAVRAIDPGLPPQSLQTMTDRMALPLWVPRTIAGFFGACGVAAVLLSTIGLFGVTYFAVSQRRREFGVRFALGATTSNVRRMVLGEALRLAGPGILAGAAAGIILGFALRSALVGLETTSAPMYVVAILLQGAVTVAASWSPASRAARSNPIDVLRAE